MLTFDEFKEIHQFINSQIKGTPFEDSAFYVGGCVRNTVLGKPIKSINICITQPNGGIAFAEFITKKLKINEDGKNPITFPKYGHAKFKLKNAFPKFANIVIEVVQSRKDAFNNVKAENPEACFGTLKDDAFRRDLTINALYCKISNGTVYDPTSASTDDIKNKTLRTCADPNITFNDDALRILRVIRFASELGWGIESKTWLGMCKHAHKLISVDKERIRDEFTKIIISPFASDGIRRLYWCGAMKYFIPEFEALKGINQGFQHNEDAFDHSLTVMEGMDLIVEYKLAGLLHDIGKADTFERDSFNGKVRFNNHENVGSAIASEILGDLKYPLDTIKSVTTAIKNHMRFKQSEVPSNHTLRKFFNEVSDKHIELCLRLIDVDNNSRAPKHCRPSQVAKISKRLEHLINQEETLKVKLPVNGKELMNRFKIRKGPKVGAMLRLLTEYYYISPRMTKEDAFKVVERAIAKNEI